MKKLNLFIVFSIVLASCNFGTDKSTTPESSPADPEVVAEMEQQSLKPINDSLPIIGLLMYDGVLTTEVTATADVFTKPTPEGKQLINVITLLKTVQNWMYFLCRALMICTHKYTIQRS